MSPPPMYYVFMASFCDSDKVNDVVKQIDTAIEEETDQTHDRIVTRSASD